MTKLRAPLSFERGLVRIAELLGWAAMGAIVNRSARTIQDWSDPDVGTQISLADAFRLEEAYVASGGDGYPISDCWRVRLGIGAPGATDIATMAALFAKSCKEGGEAHAALAKLLSPDTQPSDRRDARRELGEWVDVAQQILAHLNDGTVPEEGGVGGQPCGEGNA